MSRPGLLRKLVGYAGTGGVAAVVDLGGFVLLVGAGVHVLPAAAASFVAAAAVNFLLSARLVFGVSAGWRRFGLFLLGALMGFAVNVAATTAGALLLGLPPVAAKAAGIGIAFGFNFAINLRWVFARP